MKRYPVVVTRLALLLLLAGLFSCRVQAGDISARSAIVMDADSGRVLYEKNPDARSLIASTTKIMTALVVCEQCNVLDRVEIMPEAVGIEGSSMYLQPGEVLTVQELLYGLMLHSGNDAAVALAIYCGGTVEGFVARMNDRARSMGLENTHFENPNGLDGAHHYSTARDLATLTVEAMKNPVFAKTVSTKSVKVGQRYLTNHNKLLWRLDGAEGVKTGYTKAAGRILVSSASRDGKRIVAVTIQAPDDWNDHARLLEQGFSRYETVMLVRKGEVLASVPVLSGNRERAELMAGEDFVYPVREGERLSLEVPGPGFVFAPVAQGDSPGVVHILLDGVPVGKVPVYWAQTVEQSQEPGRRKSFFERFGGKYERTAAKADFSPGSGLPPQSGGIDPRGTGSGQWPGGSAGPAGGS